MKKLLILILLQTLFFSCRNNNQSAKLEMEILILKKSNDSLESIVNEIKDKYVFDSLTIRQIPNATNTKKINSVYKEEFVFVGYNTNGKTSVVIGDTLISKKGGFLHEVELTQDRTSYIGIFKTENDYGKTFEAHLGSSIEVKKN
ncbi:hypothetical protein [Cellulophaga sp. L1A9]|uniref:hypothetical protein n=1 Tax=Cellulophaga sp. L1A9 TaxID=2686362 RepID=UPI00131E8952|nr:hypothetical protein [Cellulophaga sp. L1A9]